MLQDWARRLHLRTKSAHLGGNDMRIPRAWRVFQDIRLRVKEVSAREGPLERRPSADGSWGACTKTVTLGGGACVDEPDGGGDACVCHILWVHFTLSVHYISIKGVPASCS